MTTTEFIELIKSCQDDRKKLFISGWDFTQSINGKPLLISESELDKIKKVNVELLEALIELAECDYTSGTHLSCAIARAKQAIKKATQ